MTVPFFLYLIPAIPHPLQLTLYIDGKLIDFMPLNHLEFTTPGYISTLKEKLEARNHQKIKAASSSPEYFIEGVPSKMKG
jgi:hypothetical protein